jgi:hypothetical protein
VLARIRRRSRWLAASWLFGQLAIAALTVATLDAIPTRTTAAGHCQCPGSPLTQTCPMHGRSAGAVHHDGAPCAMRQCSTPDATMITVATGFVVVPQLPRFDVDPDSSLAAAQPLVLDLSARPEPYPPRA